MKISTRGRYGLRAMLELARCRGESPVLMSTLAEREDISRKYLHALLTELKSAGLVRSVRGAGGGFVLSRDPAETRLSEILRAVEGPLSLVDCVSDKGVCERSNRCVARGVWQRLSGAIESMLNSITLEDLIAERKRRGSSLPGRKRAGATRQKKARSENRGRKGPQSSRTMRGGSERTRVAPRNQRREAGGRRKASKE